MCMDCYVTYVKDTNGNGRNLQIKLGTNINDSVRLGTNLYTDINGKSEKKGHKQMEYLTR